MRVYQFGDLSITLNKKGKSRYDKASYPIRYGTYHEIIRGPFVFQLNLNGEIKHAQCRKGCSMEPGEWLKRTVGNDWVYYASGGYNGAYGAVGEYYVPCFGYASNGILGGNPFEHGILEQTQRAFSETMDTLSLHPLHPPDSRFEDFCSAALAVSPAGLESKARYFHGILDGRISVLPPDARHVDYDVIPLNISKGCLYSCRFCTVKSGRGFSLLDREKVEKQIAELGQFYGKDIVNYNALFLGQHDALAAGEEMVVWAAMKAYDAFGFAAAHMADPRLFLFGSADSFLAASDGFFQAINGLPYTTYINIGLESADDRTLDFIGKPLSSGKIKEAFARMEQVNRMWPNVEITANFLYGDSLPETHMDACLGLIRDQYPRSYSRGVVYFSPYGKIDCRKSMVSGFKIIKNQCRLPAFLYIIQRL